MRGIKCRDLIGQGGGQGNRGVVGKIGQHYHTITVTLGQRLLKPGQ